MGSGFLSLSCMYILSASWLCNLSIYERACSFITAVDVHVVEGVCVPFLYNNWKLKLLLICNWVCSKPCSELCLLNPLFLASRMREAVCRRWSKLCTRSCFSRMPVACQQGRINPPQVARCAFDVSVEDEYFILGGIPMGNSVLLVSLRLSWPHALQPQDAQLQFNKLVKEFASMQTSPSPTCTSASLVERV